jgi:hypothetical protein
VAGGLYPHVREMGSAIATFIVEYFDASQSLVAPTREVASSLLVHDVSAVRSVCASAISGNSGVGEKPSSALASKAWASAERLVEL